jgi:hypothetical protein
MPRLSTRRCPLSDRYACRPHHCSLALRQVRTRMDRGQPTTAKGGLSRRLTDAAFAFWPDGRADLRVDYGLSAAPARSLFENLEPVPESARRTSVGSHRDGQRQAACSRLARRQSTANSRQSKQTDPAGHCLGVRSEDAPFGHYCIEGRPPKSWHSQCARPLTTCRGV